MHGEFSEVGEDPVSRGKSACKVSPTEHMGDPFHMLEAKNNLKPIVGPMLGRPDKSDCCRRIDKMAIGELNN
jgi:hypothetical protein